MNSAVIDVRNLRVDFNLEQGVLHAVSDISFTIPEAKTLGVVGESGCGKSVTAMSIIQLLPRPRGRIVGGEVWYTNSSGQAVNTANLAPLGAEIRRIRGNEVSTIFQEPMTSLNPVYTVGDQIAEAVMLHQGATAAEARQRAIEMLERVGIPAPEQRVDEYPHQLSGGMRQRAMIAMALSCNPRLLIADEPTTALDVTIEAQILDLMRELQSEYNMSIMMITHDLSVIAQMADEVIVMYLGHIVEKASAEEIFSNPKHPYTQGLLESVPRVGVKGRLKQIEGSVPNPMSIRRGCPFASRCPARMQICTEEEPPLFTTNDGHQAKCWLYK